MRARVLLSGLVLTLAVAAVSAVAASPATSHAEEPCNPDLLCALSGTVSFSPEKTLSSRTLRYDRKKYRRKKKVPVSFIVDQGRASVFIDAANAELNVGNSSGSLASVSISVSTKYSWKNADTAPRASGSSTSWAA